VVDVSDWFIGDLQPYSEGARDKALLYKPSVPPFDFLLPNHRYLLKKTYQEKSGTILYEQYWNEIIAYHLGRLLNIAVPPAFVAHNGDYYGVLIEWFYGYQGEDLSRRGGEVIVNYIDNYDTTKGGKHNWQAIETIFETEKVENWLHEWVQILCFDAIIGNTDRHQDNWQIVDYLASGKRSLSPAFDNGTSLGYNIRADHIPNWLNKLPKMVKNGYHHMKWQESDEKQANHFELLEKIVGKHPNVLDIVKEIAALDISPLQKQIVQLTEFELKDPAYQLSNVRADFIWQLLSFRMNHLKELFT